jgi:hypothetical protein
VPRRLLQGKSNASRKNPHDDQVDSISQALSWLSQRIASYGERRRPNPRARASPAVHENELPIHLSVTPSALPSIPEIRTAICDYGFVP